MAAAVAQPAGCVLPPGVTGEGVEAAARACTCGGQQLPVPCMPWHLVPPSRLLLADAGWPDGWCAGAGLGVWQQLHKLHQSSPDITLARRALFAMAYTSDAAAAASTLAMALASTPQQPQPQPRWNARTDAAQLSALLARSRLRGAAALGAGAAAPPPLLTGLLQLLASVGSNGSSSGGGGERPSWAVLQAVADVEVVTPAGWQELVRGVRADLGAGSQAGQLLGRAWSGVEWAQWQGGSLCGRLSELL